MSESERAAREGHVRVRVLHLDTLEALPDSMNVTVKGVWFQASFFYALTLAPQQAGATGTTTFKRWTPANTPRLTQLSTLPSPPLFPVGDDG